MKDFQQNLLIFLALCLCGLCVFQWRVQTVQRGQIGDLTRVIYEKSAAIQGYTNSISTLDHQVAEIMSHLAESQQTVRSNEQLVATQQRELGRLESLVPSLTNQIIEFKKAVETLQANLKEAYAGIKTQNEVVKDLVSQRDDLVKKFNDEVKDRNEVVSKYNDLVRQVEKSQPGAAKRSAPEK